MTCNLDSIRPRVQSNSQRHQTGLSKGRATILNVLFYLHPSAARYKDEVQPQHLELTVFSDESDSLYFHSFE